MSTPTYGSEVTVTNGTDDRCIARSSIVSAVLFPLFAISLFINLFLLLAATFDKKRLRRQSYMFACVNSTLFANILYQILSLWRGILTFTAVDQESVAGQDTVLKVIWTLCEALSVSMGFAVVSNATSLVYTALDSTYIVGRTASERGHANSEMGNMSLKYKKKFAVFLIIISWFVPITLTIIATAWWNCASECRCDFSAFEGDVCPTEGGRCSSLVAPLTANFLILNICLWFVAVVFLFGISIRKYQHYKETVSGSSASVDEEVQMEDLDTSRKRDEADSTSKNHSTNVRSNHRLPKPSLNIGSRFILAIILTALLFLCVLPIAVSVVIDKISSSPNNQTALIISALFFYIYTTACPILMVKYLPSLKSALIKMSRNLCPC